MTSRITAMLCATAAAATAAAAFIMPAPAGAEDTVKLAYIDPLSGGGASIGEIGLKTFQYLADCTNAQGGVLGKKLEIVPYDNKLNAQESAGPGAEGDRLRHPLHHPGQRLGIRGGDRGLRGQVQ